LRYLTLSVLGSRLDLSGSRDVIGHVTILFSIGDFLLAVLWNQGSISIGTVSEIVNSECNVQWLT